MSETIEMCELCDQKTMQKIFKNSFMLNKKQTSSSSKVGEITKQHIEENKKLLKEQQKEARETTYE